MTEHQQSVIYHNSLSIPEEVRGEWAAVVESTIGRMNLSERTWVYLFEMYNRFLTTPQGAQTDIGCHNCRYTVLKYSRDVVEIWKQNNVQWLRKE